MCLGSLLLHSASASEASKPAQSRVNSFPLTVTDSLGRKLTLEESPRRIISLTPSNTECLFELGAGERVVGVTSFCDYPAEAKEREKIGGFAARTISIEAIVALKPDLVLAGDRNQLSVIETLEQLGVPVLSVKVRGFEDLYTQLLQLGQILDCEASAQQQVETLKHTVDTVRKRTANIPSAQRLRVYWEVFDEPLMSCGPRSIIGQLLTLAGAVNIFEEVNDEFPQIGAEAVITRNPQVILGPELMRARSMNLEHLRARPGWSEIDALKTGRLYILPDEIVARPTPRLVRGLVQIASLLYPERFKDLEP